MGAHEAVQLFVIIYSVFFSVFAMPKDRPRRSYGGISRQVKTTTFIHPSQLFKSTSAVTASPYAYAKASHKVSRILGFKAKAEESARAKQLLKENLQCTLHYFFKHRLFNTDFSPTIALSEASREAILDLQREAGIIPADELCPQIDVDAPDDDPSWFYEADDDEPDEGQTEVIDALRDLRLSL